MIVKKERLIELLYHKDKRIQNASLQALVRFYPGVGGIVEHILKSISIFNKDYLPSLAKIKVFLPTSNDIHEIINYLYKIQDLEDEQSINIKYHFVSCLLDSPFEVIEQNHDLFLVNDDLKNMYEHIKFREDIRSKDPDILWKELEKICIK